MGQIWCQLGAKVGFPSGSQLLCVRGRNVGPTWTGYGAHVGSIYYEQKLPYCVCGTHMGSIWVPYMGSRWGRCGFLCVCVCVTHVGSPSGAYVGLSWGSYGIHIDQ